MEDLKHSRKCGATETQVKRRLHKLRFESVYSNVIDSEDIIEDPAASDESQMNANDLIKRAEKSDEKAKKQKILGINELVQQINEREVVAALSSTTQNKFALIEQADAQQSARRTHKFTLAMQKAEVESRTKEAVGKASVERSEVMMLSFTRASFLVEEWLLQDLQSKCTPEKMDFIRQTLESFTKEFEARKMARKQAEQPHREKGKESTEEEQEEIGEDEDEGESGSEETNVQPH